MKENEKPTRDMCLPFGCISAGSLRSLADSIEKLTVWHTKLRGSIHDKPCLRRIEAIGDRIEAHVSTGPAVGGSWFTYVLGPHGWSIKDE